MFPIRREFFLSSTAAPLRGGTIIMTVTWIFSSQEEQTTVLFDKRSIVITEMERSRT